MLNIGDNVEIITIDEEGSETIPEGYKKLKFDDTLEKINPEKPADGQKAPKRFFCARCMKKKIETGYTKRNDLVHHLEKCGLEIEKKIQM